MRGCVCVANIIYNSLVGESVIHYIRQKWKRCFSAVYDAVYTTPFALRESASTLAPSIRERVRRKNPLRFIGNKVSPISNVVLLCAVVVACIYICTRNIIFKQRRLYSDGLLPSAIKDARPAKILTLQHTLILTYLHFYFFAALHKNYIFRFDNLFYFFQFLRTNKKFCYITIKLF